LCDAGDLHSYRRDGERTGRQISFVKIR
jgi:copper oxidase (laccase) domain-containing protein